MSRGFPILLILLCLVLVAPAAAQQETRNQVALAYVWRDTVTLADVNGDPVENTGPGFSYGQGARLLWTADGQTLYIARDDALYATGGSGGAAVRLPGLYGRTIAFSQDTEVFYYLETATPTDKPNGNVSYPLREMSVLRMEGGVGRLAGYYGNFQPGASRADLTFAAALYVRDGGLLGSGRPNLWPTYGANILGTCCFPDPGLGLFNAGTGDFSIYDNTFIPGPAATNATRTHLAGPTTEGTIRVIDMITGGQRDYAIEIAGGLGTIERIAWSPDDTMLYFISRYDPQTPLELTVQPSFAVDTRSANISLYRLNLVSGVIRELAWRADIYGVSSLAATDNYVFAVVIDPNTALVNALNNGQAQLNTVSTDPALTQYMPKTHLWRVDAEGGNAADVMDDVWGLALRPVRAGG